MSICWYQDSEIELYFDVLPKLSIRYIEPNNSYEEIIDINKKPFINLSQLNVVLLDKIDSAEYEFSIDNGYTWDGASIPRIFWRLIGAKTDNKFLIPSLIHDVLCENHNYINNNRYLSTIVFERLLYVNKINPFNRWLIKHSVDNFQKIFGKWRV